MAMLVVNIMSVVTEETHNEGRVMVNAVFRLLIMDFDGTLADTLPDVVWCMARTFERFGCAVPADGAVLRTVGMTLEDSFRALGCPLSVQGDMAEWVRTYREIYRDAGGRRTMLFPGMASCMRQIAGSGVRLAIVSNKGIAALQAAVERLGVSDYVDRIFGGDSVRHTKPDPELFHAEIGPCYPSCSSGDVLVVGDTQTDLAFARAAGLRSCWASYGYGRREQCLACNPDYTVADAGGLLRLVIPSGSGVERGKTG